uniref:WSC domain-containing protein n=1 Tax=Macrostomum lignano TaxID=282301 RepID=A0A1I8JE00_9PLAT
MSHIGCFVDGRRRDLPTVGGKGSMTVGRCYGLCKKKGFRFFGVQIGKQCWCGNHYGRYGRRDKRECRYQCRGDKTTYCGGSWRNDVYATGVVVASKAAGVKYVGCFKDNRYRDLPVVYTANYKTTKAYCFRYCRAKGYRYFGLQNGNACTCGNTVGRYGKAKSKDCARSTCKGDKRSKCGGPWRNSVFTTGLKPKSFKTPGMSHIGCFVDGRRRDLPTVGGKGSMTVGRCYGLCKKKGFRFFGVQIGKQCWCGNHYGRYGRRDKRECRYQCRGDKTTYCGGSWRNDVYATGLEEHASGVTLLGCFRDNSKRDLPLVHGAGHRTTKAYCLKYCKSRGYRYFGLQAGSACTCGNKYGSFGRVNAKQCRTRCRGDKRRTCGGSWRNSVYSTGIGSKPVRLPGLKHLGCYLDKSSRDLRKLVLSGSVTVPKCYKACKARKYRFFGVQNGYQCWCGNHYGRYRIRSNLECRVQCRGDKSTYCGGAWRNNVYATGVVVASKAAGVKYVGCFKDNRYRDLPVVYTANYKTTKAYCFRYCRAKGYRYFGLQNGNACTCGNTVGRYGKAKSKDCARSTWRQEVQMWWTMEEQRLHNRTEAQELQDTLECLTLRCFVDGRRRDLPTVGGKGSMTVGRCYGLCKKKGFRFFGVQIGKQCWCGNHYGRYGRRDKRECRYQCRGDKTTYCGGSWRNDVYATGLEEHASGVTLLGCFRDNSKRDLPLVQAPAYCLKYCKSRATGTLASRLDLRAPAATNMAALAESMQSSAERAVEATKDEPAAALEKLCLLDWNRQQACSSRQRLTASAMSSQGLQVLWLQNGNACTCGNTVGRYGKAKSKDCARSTCKGDKRSKCGGPWRNSVFTTGLKPKSFKRKQCWCGNHYGRYGRRDKRECRYQCRGDKTTYCGGSWRNESPGMSHIGCFVDGRRRDLPTVGGKGSITVGRCYGLCKKKGFRFFGVQIGKQCWCGNHYGRYGRRDKRECRYQCRGDKTTYCGGSWRNDVYATGLEEHASGVTLLGCFRDNSKRDLPLAYCLKYCKSRGYRYFGLQAGSACTCGNKYGSFGRVNAKQCRTRCRGDKRRTCGGSWRNSVYTRLESAASLFVHLGCYLDKSSRDLRKLVLSGSVTVPKCYKACKARKYRFFGVQNGYQCWCGNHYGRYRIRSNLEC